MVVVVVVVEVKEEEKEGGLVVVKYLLDLSFLGLVFADIGKVGNDFFRVFSLSGTRLATVVGIRSRISQNNQIKRYKEILFL